MIKKQMIQSSKVNESERKIAEYFAQGYTTLGDNYLVIYTSPKEVCSWCQPLAGDLRDHFYSLFQPLNLIWVDRNMNCL